MFGGLVSCQKFKDVIFASLIILLLVKPPLHPWEWPSRPWARVHTDHAGPFNGKLFLILIDAHSKWMDVKIVSSTSSEVTIATLHRIFATHGLLEHLVSNPGFRSRYLSKGHGETTEVSAKQNTLQVSSW